LSLVMIDLDHFKRINDTRGHLAGDAVLKGAAGAIAATLRAEDLLGRYGGEEFVVIARGIPLANAAQLAERLRIAVERTIISFDGHPIPVTASMGVSSLRCLQLASEARG